MSWKLVEVSSLVSSLKSLVGVYRLPGKCWAETYCVSRVVRGDGLALIEPGKFKVAEEAVRAALERAAHAFDTLIASS